MDVSKHLDRAEKEAAKKNWDAAILIFDQIISLDPDNGTARAGKRNAQIKKAAKAYPSSGSILIKNAGYNFGLFFGKLLRLSGMVISLAEKALSNDPKNVKLNVALGQALLRRGFKNGAEAQFAVVAEFDASDVESLRTLGRLYYDAKKWDAALQCYEKVLKISPRDQESIKMRKNLAAEGAIKTGGFETAATARDLARSQEQLEQLEKQQRLVKSASDIENAVKDLIGACKTDPKNADNWLRLGNLYVQQRQTKEAIDAFTKALELRPDDFDTSCRLGDVRLADFDTRIRESKELADTGDEGADDQMRRLVRERRKFRVDEFQRRVGAHPTDTGLRQRLGQYLLDDGQVDEAIAEFQHVVKDPKRKFQAMTFLGQAFLKKGLGDLAVKQLTQALEGSGGVNDKTKDIAYSLAAAYEQQQRHKDALEAYSRIFEIDIAFRDVGAKIESLRGRVTSD